MKTALLIIDVQNDYFPNGNCELFQSELALKEVKRLQNFFRKKELPVYIMGQSFFSWDCHHIVYWLVTPPLTGWKSNAVRLLPTAKNSRTI